MKFYFTFGCNQMFEGGYHIVDAKTRDAAIVTMNKIFGGRWSMIYRSSEEAGVEMYGLFRVKLSLCQVQSLKKLNELLMMDHGLTDNDVQWIENFSKARELTPKIMKVINEIYERVVQ